MDDDRARTLLEAERSRVERLLGETVSAGQDDRDEANAGGDMDDPAERLTADPAAELTVEESRDS